MEIFLICILFLICGGLSVSVFMQRLEIHELQERQRTQRIRWNEVVQTIQTLQQEVYARSLPLPRGARPVPNNDVITAKVPVPMDSMDTLQFTSPLQTKGLYK